MEPQSYESHADDGAAFEDDAALVIVEYIADTYLNRLNGAMRLIDRNFNPVWIRGVGSLDTNRYRWFTSNSIDRSTIFEKDDRAKEIVRSWYFSATQDNSVSSVLHAYANSKLGWASLYTIYEIIKADIDGPVARRGWISKKDEERFKRTANQCREVQEEMRHGSVPDPNWDPSILGFSLWEGRILIERTVWKWLAEKIGDPNSENIARVIEGHSIDGNYWLSGRRDGAEN